MHDQSLEQKLRTALQAEGDRLTLTITSAELERRLALRRRGGSGRMASLGLAAAVTVALIGLAGVAGGWFESPPVVPAPSSSAAPDVTPAPTIGPSIGPAPAALPTLEDLLAPLDPGAIVEAQAAGPATGTLREDVALGGPLGPGSTKLAPVPASGTYRLWIACLGDTALGVDLLRNIGSSQAFDPITITCDGQVTVRQISLFAGDALLIDVSGSGSWRTVLELPGRAGPHATALESLPAPRDGERVLLAADSGRVEPSYGPPEPSASLDPSAPAEIPPLGGVEARDRYAVLASCAGPGRLRYAIGNRVSDADPAVDGQRFEEIVGVVACDGLAHRTDVLVAVLSGGELYVTADERSAWTVSIVGEQPQIAVPENTGSWTLSTAIGPFLDLNGQPEVVSLVGADGGGRVRIVVGCQGDGPLHVAVDTGEVEGQTVDPFDLDCSNDAGNTYAKTYSKAAGNVLLTLDPGGKRMWLMAATQVATP
jgi:hypothetical protein